jgi:glycosyltransferase involved in cell wall biosynthesis
MRIALFSPLNPVTSGISDYTEEMLPEMAKHLDIDLYIDKGYQPEKPEIVENFAVIPFNRKTFQPGKYDEILYHMGNSYLPHRYIYEAMREFPGIVVLHDYLFQGFYAEKYAADKDFESYAGLQEKYYGEKGRRIARHIADGLPDPIWDREEGIDYPLNEEIIPLARALIVHSVFVKKKISGLWELPMATINHHGHHLKAFDNSKIRASLGISGEEILILSTGFINRNKRLHIAIPAVTELNLPRVKYLVVGKDGSNLLKRIVDPSNKNVIIKGYVPLEELEGYISAADLCINLRYPTMGESSGALMRMMSCGKAVVVTDCGSYSDLPDYAVLKIDADIDEKEMLKRCLYELIRDRDFRCSLGREARTFMESECSIGKCAREYARFIREVHDSVPSPSSAGKDPGSGLRRPGGSFEKPPVEPSEPPQNVLLGDNLLKSNGSRGYRAGKRQ